MEITQSHCPETCALPAHHRAIAAVQVAVLDDITAIIDFFPAHELPSTVELARWVLHAAVDVAVDTAAGNLGVRRLQLVPAPA